MRDPLIALVFWVIVGCACAYMAKQRNRNPFLWFFIGMLFSFFGLFCLIAIPDKSIPPIKKKDVKVPDIQIMYNEAATMPDEPLEPYVPTLRISRDSTIDWYFLDQTSTIIGPLKLPALRKALIESKLDTKAYLWCEEFLEWTQISKIQNGATILDPDFL